MKILVIKEVDSFNDFESLEIVIDDVHRFNVRSTEYLEDNTLSANFEDCYNIPELLKLAYEAGKRGEAFEVEYEDEY